MPVFIGFQASSEPGAQVDRHGVNAGLLGEEREQERGKQHPLSGWTLLYRTVHTHLATWLERSCDTRQGGFAPAHVEREFRRYLE
jgi:hypothetical protein